VLAVRGAIQHAAVLGDHAIEELDRREDLEQILELPARDKDELPPRIAEPLEGRECLLTDDSIARQRAVVIAGQDEITHGYLRSLGPQ
jgi:hypothetical protein